MPVWAQGRISLQSFELMQSLIWRNTETCFTSEAIAQLNFMSVEQEANPRSQSLLCCVNDRLFLSVWSWWRFSVSVKWRMEGTPRLASFLSLLSVVQAPQVGTMLPCQEMLSNNWEIRWLALGSGADFSAILTGNGVVLHCSSVLIAVFDWNSNQMITRSREIPPRSLFRSNFSFWQLASNQKPAFSHIFLFTYLANWEELIRNKLY